jgi:nucleotidyltransferase/DNA polymerase involved in DNA repair
MATCVESVAPSVVARTPSKPLSPVDVAQLPGVDVTVERALRAYGVLRVQQLRRLPKPVLVAAFGDSSGRQLWASARGLDSQPKRTVWTQLSAGFDRLRRWLVTSPRSARGTQTVAISSPDTAKA